MYSLEDLAYFAGIIDGEGSIGIEHLKPTKGRKKDYYVCRLTVINTSLRLMNWIKDTFGGQFDQRKEIPGRKTCYRWHIFGKDMENILKAVEPLLKVKKPQAGLLLKYRRTVGKTGWLVNDTTLSLRKHLWQTCKEFNANPL
jgi:hypothetical protein